MKVRSRIKGILVTVALFLAALTLLVLGLGTVKHRSDGEQAASLKNAVLRATLTCYAIEGRYPSSVHHLEALYGLQYDHLRYIVTLNSFADNLLPDIYVLTQGEGSA